jgi:RNA polymerase sigma factor (sigma-70 family)
MPTFDIVSKIDGQTLDNAINTAKKEILNRYDFNDSKSTVELDKKTNEITIVTENDMRLKAIQDAIKALPEKCQLVFSLSRYSDMSNKEIAEHLDISIKSVEKHISKALKELRISLKPYIHLIGIFLTRVSNFFASG